MNVILYDTSNPVALALLIAASVVCCVFVCMYYIGRWLTLQKMGRHDFAALIPCYDIWEFSRGTGLKAGGATLLTVLFTVISAVEALASTTVSTMLVSFAAHGSALNAEASGFANTLIPLAQSLFEQQLQAGRLEFIAVLACSVVLFILRAYLYFGIARTFNHGAGYMLGLLFLAPIFFVILGASRNQVYQGLLRDKSYLANPRNDWTDIVQSRIATFGSNAPLVLAVMGMGLGCCFITVPGIVFCVIALVKNGAERDKPLAQGKSRATTIVAVLGIILSIAVVVLAFLFSAQILALARAYQMSL